MYTTEEIISSIQRIAAVPVGQPGLSNDQYIAILNREMTSAICPFIISVQEEYIIEYTDTLIGSGTEFTIPSKAIAGKLREVKIYDSSDLSIRNVPRISLNDLGNNVFGFYMLGNKVMLTNSAGLENKYLRMYFYWRPNKLALLTDCAVIQSVSGATATTTGIPGAFTNPTFYADLIKHESQFDVLYENVQVTVSGNDIIFPSNIPLASAGDYIAPTDYSPIPVIPEEVIPLLEQAAALRVLENLNDQAGMQAAMVQYQKLKSDIIMLLNPRVAGELKVIRSKAFSTTRNSRVR